jgi:glycosyltransferase involved in cell wall biosynthesis
MWDAYDRIASISDRVTESFLKAFPELEKKILLIPNIMPVCYLDSMTKAFSAEQEMPHDDSIRLLSVGRFCTAKNFDNVPDICRKLREMGLNVKWYLIGFGGGEALIRQKIAEVGIEKEVIILGKKENPYPYIAACDLYVQPSRYEGKCVSVIEAQILHKPVVITNYSTSGSQLRDGYDGVIVPMDNAGCAEGIAAVIRNPQLQQRLVENTKQQDYTNAAEIQKLYQLIEG